MILEVAIIGKFFQKGYTKRQGSDFVGLFV